MDFTCQNTIEKEEITSYVIPTAAMDERRCTRLRAQESPVNTRRFV